MEIAAYVHSLSLTSRCLSLHDSRMLTAHFVLENSKDLGEICMHIDMLRIHLRKVVDQATYRLDRCHLVLGIGLKGLSLGITSE